ncbi:MAG: right-handed parallel beta-helix repeat-containing protein, partial [Thermoplasmatota archaeon]
MERKRSTAVMVLIFLLSSGALFLAETEDVDAATTWIVDKSGSGTHTTISGAVAAASSGDTILIRSGTYSESITITCDDLTLIGSGTSNTIVSPGTNNNGFSINADDINISELAINNGIIGIDVLLSANYGMYNVRISSSFQHGVELINCIDSKINNCLINNSTSTGIRLFNSDNTIVKNNSLIANNINIYTSNSKNCIYEGNRIKGGSRGIEISTSS